MNNRKPISSIQTHSVNHRDRHVLLHKMLDELVTDYIANTQNANVVRTSILELMEWSARQENAPDHAGTKHPFDEEDEEDEELE